MATKYRTAAHIIIMSAIVLSTTIRVSINAFQFPSRTLYKRWASSAAYGRTTFRHPPGDMSWRMTASSDDASTSAPSIDTSTETALQQYQNKNNLDDQVFSAISADGGLKVTVATIRNLLNEFMIQESPSLCCFVVCYGVFAAVCTNMCCFSFIFINCETRIFQHTMNAVPGDALGRATLCALMSSNGMQEEQIFQLTFKSDGPVRGCVAIVNGRGEAKGYVGNPSLGDDFTLQEAIGTGTVQVVKNHPDWPNPYNGITQIRHSDIDRDVGIYLAESEQRSCALAAATSFNGILCTAAGGYLVERLPDCSPDTMNHMERNLAKLIEMNGEDGESLPTNLMLEGKTPVDIASVLLDGLGMEPLNQVKPSPKCQCSEEKLIRSLVLIPREEVDTILREEGKVEARCEFCGKVYRMGPEEVEKKLAQVKGDASIDSEWEKEEFKKEES